MLPGAFMQSGIKIPVIEPDQAIRGLAAAMKRMAEDDELRTHPVEGGESAAILRSTRGPLS